MDNLDSSDFKMHDFDKDLDPDSHLRYNLADNCKYYTNEEFNLNVTLDTVSFIHFNIRSLYANFNKLKDYLATFASRFNIIALSESWLNTEKGADFEMEGYNLYHIDRSGKRGGVSCYMLIAL